MNIDYLIAEKWFGQNRTCRTGSAAPVVHFWNSRAYMCTLVCIHESFCSCTRPLCQGQYEVKSTLKFIFIFLHYLPAYQSEAIKIAAGLGLWLPAREDFHSSKLANYTLGWPQLTLRQKRRQISPYELFSNISQYIFIAYANFPCIW